jgi:hypothetical protein
MVVLAASVLDPDAQPPVDLSRPDALARAFATLREESLALLAQLTPADRAPQRAPRGAGSCHPWRHGA